MSELEETLMKLNGGEWVLFDVDYTLTEPKEPALKMSVIKQNKDKFKSELKSFNESERLMVPVLMVTQSESVLTQPEFPSLLTRLHEKKVKTMGFTAIDTASLPDVGSVPRWREKELSHLALLFDPPFQASIEFTDFPPFRKTYPLYHSGVLYANVLPSKGDVLKAFLEQFFFKPQKIVFVDDTLDNLLSVQEALKETNISFTGLHYKIEAETIPEVTDSEWRQVWDKLKDRARSLD